MKYLPMLHRASQRREPGQLRALLDCEAGFTWRKIEQKIEQKIAAPAERSEERIK